MIDREPTRKEMIVTRELIESRRGPKTRLDPLRPVAVIQEYEPTARPTADEPKPTIADVTSVFLTGAECAFRCTMCDLWTHTLDVATPAGAIPVQIDVALRSKNRDRSATTESPQWIKLYNSSNFFDPRCVPREDWDAIATKMNSFDRVIVENHPRLVNSTVGQFASIISGKLEVAMGLETVYQPSIKLLNKQLTLADFESAANHLQSMGVEVRTFILLQPPGMPPAISADEVGKSLRFASQCGSRHASIIATRGGNGIMEELAAKGLFKAPSAFALERCFDVALCHNQSMVVTADLWGFEGLRSLCDLCAEPRRERLAAMNLSQLILPPCELTCGCSDD